MQDGKYKRIYDILREYAADGRIPMHMPGHKRAERFDYLQSRGASLDITEINGFDDLHAPEGIIKESQTRMAELWHADFSHILVGGSTCGILSAVYSVCGNGGALLMARNCHRSVYYACEAFGISADYILPRSCDRPFEGSVSPADVREAIERGKSDGRKYNAVIVTSPTYQGVISDIAEISRVCHENGIPLICDEAHGAHLSVLPDFPSGAVQNGADIVIQSLHKTLPSLTQTAVAHVKSEYEREFSHALDIFMTSSPSYPLIASADGCADYIIKHGKELSEKWASRLDMFYKKAEELESLEILRGKTDGIYGTDQSKIIISPGDAFTDGYSLSCRLREKYNIECEMASSRYVLAMTGVGDTEENLNSLFLALKAEDKTRLTVRGHDKICPPCIPEKIYGIAQARGMKKETVKLSDAAGRISAGYVIPYPPGIPVIVPGEKFGENTLKYLDDTGYNSEFAEVIV